MARSDVERRLLQPAGLVLAVAALLVLLPGAANAADETPLKVPRFVSVRSEKVNLRAGPGNQYPIEWVLVRRDMPFEVIQQYDHWRKVRGWDGTVGWVQEHMLAGKRFAVVKNGDAHPIYRTPDTGAAVIAKAEPGVLAKLAECRGAWCRIETDDVSGWMRRTDIWGVYPEENVP